MRDGSVLAGNIVSETADMYRTVIQTPTAPMMTNVPIRAVRYVVYGTAQKARANLDLDRVARVLNARDTATVRFLPTEAFGEAVQEAVQSARSRIWILAYFISGGSHETIQAIYNTVREKARAGMDTLVISEFGKGTPMPIRNATLNYANTLEEDASQSGLSRNTGPCIRKSFWWTMTRSCWVALTSQALVSATAMNSAS